MSRERQRYVFGPVPSRRLGRSLGVDLVPMKTCTYNCVYCQIGPAPPAAPERKIYADPAAVVKAVGVRLEQGAAPDVITISGSGEPTLHLELGRVIAGIKGLTDVPVAVLTNGSLLYLPEVRQALLAADIVAPDLDAGSPEAFARINRPHPALDFERVVQGLADFAAEYQGRLLLEVFLVQGINEGSAEVKRIAAIAGRIRNAQVQLNTVTRPAAEPSARSVGKAKLDELARAFHPAAQVIADFRARAPAKAGTKAQAEEVREMLARRPCTLEDMAQGLGLSAREAQRLVEELLARKKVRAYEQGGRLYYAVSERERR